MDDDVQSSSQDQGSGAALFIAVLAVAAIYLMMHNTVVRALVLAGAAMQYPAQDEPAARKPLHDHREVK